MVGKMWSTSQGMVHGALVGQSSPLWENAGTNHGVFAISVRASELWVSSTIMKTGSNQNCATLNTKVSHRWTVVWKYLFPLPERIFWMLAQRSPWDAEWNPWYLDRFRWMPLCAVQGGKKTPKPYISLLWSSLPFTGKGAVTLDFSDNHNTPGNMP